MIELDIRGQVCPNATGSVFTAMRDLPAGETLTGTGDYPPARATIPVLIEQAGGTSTLRDLEDGGFVIEIAESGAPDSARRPVSRKTTSPRRSTASAYRR